MITLNLIKAIVEGQTNIVDMSIQNRDMDFVEARWIYFNLARKFTDYSLQSIGSVVERNHATVLHGLKELDNALNIGRFKLKKEYLFCFEYFEELSADMYKDNNLRTTLSIDDYNQYLKAKYLTDLDEANEEIERLESKLNFFRKNPLMRKILNLTPDEVQELNFKFDNFFRVKEHFRKKKAEIN